MRKRQPPSIETRQKISAAHMGKTMSEEARAKMRAHVFTDEHRRKIAAKSKGNKNRLGAVIPQEMRDRISAKLKGRTISADVRARMSAGHKGRNR